jgi:competence protein ComEC
VVERFLVSDNRDELTSDLVIIPHHGSKASSSRRFAQAVSPKYAIVSTGYRNRYGFPSARVVSRWKGVGARVMNTAELGAIELKIAPDGSISATNYHRLSQQRYWHQSVISRM